MAKINGIAASKVFGLAFSKINGIIFTSEPVEPPFEIEYATDGLVIYLDGIQNTRKGHSTSIQSWDDLMSEDIIFTVDNLGYANNGIKVQLDGIVKTTTNNTEPWTSII